MRPKKSSRAFVRASKRFAGLKSIDPALDLGNGLAIATFEQQLQEFQDALNDYNAELSIVDAKTQRIRAAERQLSESSERWLAAVLSRYGKDSEEYQKAGGIRKSLRKRPTRKATLPTDSGLPMAASLPNKV